MGGDVPPRRTSLGGSVERIHGGNKDSQRQTERVGDQVPLAASLFLPAPMPWLTSATRISVARGTGAGDQQR